MNRVVHFEIHTADPQKATEFYKSIFGWKIEQWEKNEYWMVTTGEEDKANPGKWPGINGGILLRKGNPPIEGQAVNAYVCTIEVEDLDEIVNKIITAGGTIAVPKFAFTGMAWQAYCKDIDGNIFGLHQPDTNAK